MPDAHFLRLQEEYREVAGRGGFAGGYRDAVR
jgi:hypothetical protein